MKPLVFGLALGLSTTVTATALGQNYLINGDFEAAPFDAGWSNPTVSSGGTYAQQGVGLTAGSSNSAFIPAGQSPITPVFGQAIETESPLLWELSFLVASDAPSGDRSLAMLLQHQPDLPDTAAEGQINLRVAPDGSVFVYETVAGGTSGWRQALAPGSFLFSDDVDGTTAENLDIFQMTLTGDYASETPSYTVALENLSTGETAVSDDLTYWQYAAPAAGEAIALVEFASYTGDYIIDNMSLTAVPEPATASLLLLGATGLLRRRRA